jgi:hypothetical protein
MLGEQIAELKGKVTSQRVLDSEGPSIETTISFDPTTTAEITNPVVIFASLKYIVQADKKIIHEFQ